MCNGAFKLDVKKLQISVIAKNHPTKLLECFERIYPQIDDDCLLLIFDDGDVLSTEPMLEKTVIKPNITLIRQKKPIGYDAASLRIIEYSECQWIWTIKDIDLPLPTAIKQIKSLIAIAEKEVGIIKFESSENFILEKSNLDTEINDGNFAGKLALAATSIYYRPSILTLQPAYRAISTQACHAILAVEHLKNGGKIKCHTRTLFESIGDACDSQLEFQANFYRANIFLDSNSENADLNTLENILSLYYKLAAKEAFSDAHKLEKQKGFHYALFVYTEFVWSVLLQRNKYSQKILNIAYYFLWRLRSKYISMTSKYRSEKEY